MTPAETLNNSVSVEYSVQQSENIVALSQNTVTIESEYENVTAGCC